MNHIYLLLGSNLGDRLGYLEQACQFIDQEIGMIVIKSGIYETAAWGLTDQSSFLNQAIRLYSPVSAQTLLRKTKQIENNLARVRNQHWGPRTIDIDILLFNDEVIVEEGLVIPHRLMHKRRFALAPMVEIAPDMLHPIMGLSLKTLLDQCEDKLTVQKVIPLDV